MAYPMGEAKPEPLRVDFDRRVKLEFHGSDISSDGGLLPYRELDHALELTKLGLTRICKGNGGFGLRGEGILGVGYKVFGVLVCYRRNEWRVAPQEYRRRSSPGQ